MSHQILSSSEDETIRIGAAVGRMLRPGDTVLLSGELGSGKTRLAKGIVSAAAGVAPDDVVSPTFTLVNSYEGSFPVHHADLYRLDPGQVNGIGLDDAVEDGGALVVEWAEKMPGDGDALRISIEYADSPDARIVIFQWHSDGSWGDRIATVMDSMPDGKAEGLHEPLCCTRSHNTNRLMR